MRNGKVLIVDGDGCFRQWLREILSLSDFVVCEARSLQEIDTGFGAELALLLLDYNAISESSLAWLKGLRESGNSVPLIVMSSRLMESKRFNCLRNVVGVSLFLEKPFSADDFLEQLKSILPAHEIKSTCGATFDYKLPASGQRKTFDRLRSAAVLDQSAMFGQTDTCDTRPVAVSVAIEREEVVGLDEIESRKLLDELKSFSRKSQELIAIQRDQESFSFNLFQEWTTLGNLIDDARTGDQSALSQMNALVHRICDTSDLFGYTLVGDIAHRIECLHQQSSNCAQDGRESFWAQVIDYFDRGKALINTAVSVPKEPCSECQFLPRVVLISDDPNFDNMIQLLSSSNLADVFRFDRLADALIRCQVESFDLVLIDIDSEENQNIPASCSQLRMALRRSAPIGVLYATETDLDPVGIELAGISELICMPIDHHLLGVLIHKMLRPGSVNNPRVLVLDADTVLCHYLKSELTTNSYSVMALSDPARINEVLEEFDPDVVVVDESLASKAGRAIAYGLKEDTRYKDVPVIVLTETDSLETQLRSYKSGADLCISKPILARHLISSVDNLLIRSRRAVLKKSVDKMTGTLLGPSFFSEAGQLMAQQLHRNSKLVVAIVQVSDYYELVMTQGLDAVINAVASAGIKLQSLFAPEVLKCRWGQNSFALAFPRDDTSTVVQALERMTSTLRLMRFAGRASEFGLSISVGIADTDVETSLGALICHAYRDTTNGARQDHKLTEALVVSTRCSEADSSTIDLNLHRVPRSFSATEFIKRVADPVPLATSVSIADQFLSRFKNICPATQGFENRMIRWMRRQRTSC